MDKRNLSGRYGNLTKEQEQILRTLILRVKKEGIFCEKRHDIYYFLRFLRARNFDIEKSYQMFYNCEKWRKDNNIDDIYKHFVYTELKEVEKIYPKYYHNVDIYGRPIYIEQFGRLNLKRLYEHTTDDRLIKNLILDYETGLNERFPSCSNAVGYHVETGLTIMDLKDVSLMQFSKCVNFIKKTSKIASDYYPECMGSLFVINAPKTFTMCWKLIKGILDPVTTEKIQILGKNYEKVLLNYVAPENLPKIFGGTCQCENGCSHSNIGPWNDPQYNHKEVYPITIDEFLKKTDQSDITTLNDTTSDDDTELTLSEFNKFEMRDKEQISTYTSSDTLPTPPQTPSSPLSIN